MVNEIALLGDSDEQFLIDLSNLLKGKGLPVVFLKLSEEEMPIRYKYRVIVDRASYCDSFIRAMVKNHSLKGTYVINNPFTSACDDKIIELSICQKLGIPYPKTIILPKIDAEEADKISIQNLDASLSRLRFPIVLKPHDGYAWDYVSIANTPEEAKRTYDSQKSQMVLLAQEMVRPKTYYRVYFFRGMEPLFVRYMPQERRYVSSDCSDIRQVMHLIRDYTIRLNTALDYDFNACEWAVDENDSVFLIDALNETPELEPGSIPQEYYRAILERFSSLAIEKFRSRQINKWPFEYSP